MGLEILWPFTRNSGGTEHGTVRQGAWSS